MRSSSLQFESVAWLLEQQVEIMGEPRVSLHSLWRAAGCPDGREPEIWLGLAQPLIEGVVDYLRVLPDRPSSFSGTAPLIQRWGQGDADPWRPDDVIVHEIFARIYAIYLNPRH